MTSRSKTVRWSLVSGLLLIASACGTGPDDLVFAGTWQGTAQLPNAFTTTLTLTQSGNTLGGNIQITGELNQSFIGTWDPTARTVEWIVFDGCEEWTGTFAVTADGSQMSGPVLNDLSGCLPPGNDRMGTISVSKQ